jgi:hypothetical protein
MMIKDIDLLSLIYFYEVGKLFVIRVLKYDLHVFYHLTHLHTVQYTTVE